MSNSGTILEYEADNITCIGEYFSPDGAASDVPVVLVAHAWDGLNQEVRDKASKLAEQGYIAFAIDIHGGGKVLQDMSELESALGPFMADRGMLLRRMQGAAAAAATIPGADAQRLGAMGYCFGGTAVLDLVRAGTPGLKAAVSFHGGLAGNDLENATQIDTKVLVLHGEDDPLVPPEQVAQFKAEMTAAKADWQLVSYGHTLHGFTRPGANNPDFGTLYNAAADRRSWQAMSAFFSEEL